MRYSIFCSAAALWLGLAAGCNATLTQGGGGDGSGDMSISTSLQIQPATLQTLAVQAGQMSPTASFTVTAEGIPVDATWSVDRGEIGSLSTTVGSMVTFVPRGTAGGLVTVRATYGGTTVTAQILVQLSGTQNGSNGSIPSEAQQIATSVPQLTAGGGIGGVGGEGLGPAVTDANTLSALATPTSDGSTEKLTFLYPYDGTVFPRGMLAPNLMWDYALADADAVRIDISSTSGSFTWSGTFGRPAILAQTMGPFVRHPIPQDVWEMATNSAGGKTPTGQADRLLVSLTVAKGGKGYGPIRQSWTVAPARLSGIIYYNSYGTLLAQNHGGAVGGNGMFGGAVLSIHVGDTAPKLTAGASGNDAQCRTCHSVAANGASMVVQHGDNYGLSSSYTLTPTSAAEATMTNGATFPGIFPDGTKALSPGGQLLPLPGGGSLLPVSGLAAVSTNLGTPAFSPAGTLVAFNPMQSNSISNPTQKLVVMSFDPATGAFSKPVTVVDDTGQPADTRPGWPAVAPDGQSVIFQHQTKAGSDGNGDGALYTRKGVLSHIAWTSITGANSVTPLNQLNGKTANGTVYLPKLATPKTLACTADGVAVGGIGNDHSTDVDLNYEPTVNPIASGGYVWVVFTSRRMYGNLATIPPFCSDPRGVDLVKNITTKKLWVAAIDVSGKPGSDASHPAFYLPAQELLAGNARGFWVLDPCKSNGQSCVSGDQCCNGFCDPIGPGGALQCTSGTSGMCSGLREKCATAADCCDKTNLCVNNFCTENIIG